MLESSAEALTATGESAEDEAGGMKLLCPGVVLCRWVQSQLWCACLGMVQQPAICKEEGFHKDLKQLLADPQDLLDPIGFFLLYHRWLGRIDPQIQIN